MFSIDVETLKEKGKYKGYHDEYGFVYEVEGALYSLKGGRVSIIREELVL